MGKHNHVGENNAMFGKKHSPESIEKMRISARNRKERAKSNE